MDFLITVNQTLVYLIFVLPIRFFFRVKGDYDPIILHKLDRQRGLIIISNHTNKLDPFVILASLPFKLFLNLLPIHFMTSSNYLLHWQQKIFLIPLGCYPHKTKDADYSSLTESEVFLSRGGRVFIFPEGRIKRVNDRIKAKRGVGVLLKQTDYPVIPIRIQGLEGLTIKKMLARKINVSVRMGNIINKQSVNAAGNSPERIALELMDRIYDIG